MKSFSHLLTVGLVSFASTAALAGGPDVIHSSLPSGFFLGIDGGFGANLASNQANYAGRNGTPLSTSQSFKAFSYDPAGLVGASIGYTKPIGNTSAITALFSFNYDIGKSRSELGSIIDVETPSGEAYALRETTNPQYQSNIEMKLSHLVTNNLAIFADIGGSILTIKTQLNVTDNGSQAGNTAGTFQSESHNLWGGIVGMGADYIFNPHSSVEFIFKNYIYASTKLNDLSGIDTAGTSNLLDRKLSMILPSFLINYSYYF